MFKLINNKQLQALGIALAVVAALVFKEAAPDVPDLEGEGTVEASLDLFHYAQEVDSYTDTEIAKVSMGCVSRLPTSALCLCIC